ncbi:MAG TPA: RNA methyltransferase [Candidatus Cloacimonadota bacterium]|nr:RNA methyltransferase [Candidatus Cloacimonadota bacterium]
MKYRPNISLQVFSNYNIEKKKRYLFLILKEIERANDEQFALLKDEFLNLLDVSKLNHKTDAPPMQDKHDFINHYFEIFKEEFYSEKDFHFHSTEPHIYISNKDNQNPQRTYPLVLLLHNLRSAFNVGAIIRTAECFGIEELIFTGYTALPSHPKVVNTAMNAQSKIKWQYHENIFAVIEKYKEMGYTIYALETAEPSVSLFEHQFPDKNLLILGNEALGIEPIILPHADHILQIPLFGWKNSLNVATATAIAVYEIIKQASPMRG